MWKGQSWTPPRPCCGSASAGCEGEAGASSPGSPTRCTPGGALTLCFSPQGTCGSVEGSHPVTRRAPAGSMCPTTCAECPWGPWTRWGRGWRVLGSLGSLPGLPTPTPADPLQLGRLHRACVPGLGHRQQSPGQPWAEPGDGVSPHRRAAPRAQGARLGLRHRGECVATLLYALLRRSH